MTHSLPTGVWLPFSNPGTSINVQHRLETKHSILVINRMTLLKFFMLHSNSIYREIMRKIQIHEGCKDYNSTTYLVHFPLPSFPFCGFIHMVYVHIGSRNQSFYTAIIFFHMSTSETKKSSRNRAQMKPK